MMRRSCMPSGIKKGDNAQLRTQKQLSFWTATSISVIAVLHTFLPYFMGDQIAAMLMVLTGCHVAAYAISILWYFVMKSHVLCNWLNLLTALFSGPVYFLGNNCDMRRIHTDCFLIAIVAPMMYIIGGGSVKISAITGIFNVAVTICCYGISLAMDDEIRRNRSWCFSYSSSYTLYESVTISVWAQITQCLAMWWWFTQSQKTQQAMRQDALLSKSTLGVMLKMDMDAIDSLIAEWETLPKGARSETHEYLFRILRQLKRFRRFLPDTLFHTAKVRCGTAPGSPDSSDSDGFPESDTGSQYHPDRPDIDPPASEPRITTVRRLPGVFLRAADRAWGDSRSSDSVASCQSAPAAFARSHQHTSSSSLNRSQSNSGSLVSEPRILTPICPENIDGVVPLKKSTSDASMGLDYSTSVRRNPTGQSVRRAKSKRHNSPPTSAISTSMVMEQKGLQKRSISVLVATVPGVSAMAQSMGVDIENPLTEVVEIMVNAVKRHRGAVVRFAGGTIFAAWNAVSPQRGHARYACQCALRLRGELARCRVFGPVNMAVCTAEMVVGHLGTSQQLYYNVLGTTADLCFMLCSLGARLRTSILVMGETYSELQDQFVMRGVDVLDLHAAGGAECEEVPPCHLHLVPLCQDYRCLCFAFSTLHSPPSALTTPPSSPVRQRGAVYPSLCPKRHRHLLTCAFHRLSVGYRVPSACFAGLVCVLCRSTSSWMSKKRPRGRSGCTP